MAKHNVAPILKWAGGKRQLLSEIKNHLPKDYSTYYEPFFGGGAVLFTIQPRRAIISDINKDLILTYNVVKNNSTQLIESLKKHENTSEYFYELRDKDRDSSEYQNMSDVEKASRLIYLNKTCYNGLFRVNSLGHFNTPFANYKNPNIVNEDMIKNVSAYFNQSVIKILNLDFERTVRNAQKGDFIYFDPPYDPVSDTSSFTGYNQNGFSRSDQERLKKLCDKLNNKGVYFLLSNSATQFIKELYKDYEISIVNAKRNVNSKGNGRGFVEEVLVRNYK